MKKFNIKLFNKKIHFLEKIEKPAVNYSEKYCENIDLRTVIRNLPGIGQALDDLFAYKGSKILKKRINLFFKKTHEKLKKIDEEKIDKEYLESEEFFYIFQRILRQVSLSEEKEKVELFRNIFIKSIKIDGASVYYKERFVNMLADLSIIHIEILKYYYEREKVFLTEHRGSAQCFTSFSAIVQKLNSLLSEFQVETFCKDLMRYNLVSDIAIGKYDYQEGHYRITANGRDFVDFISEDV